MTESSSVFNFIAVPTRDTQEQQIALACRLLYLAYILVQVTTPSLATHDQPGGLETGPSGSDWAMTMEHPNIAPIITAVNANFFILIVLVDVRL